MTSSCISNRICSYVGVHFISYDILIYLDISVIIKNSFYIRAKINRRAKIIIETRRKKHALHSTYLCIS